MKKRLEKSLKGNYVWLTEDCFNGTTKTWNGLVNHVHGTLIELVNVTLELVGPMDWRTTEHARVIREKCLFHDCWFNLASAAVISVCPWKPGNEDEDEADD